MNNRVFRRNKLVALLLCVCFILNGCNSGLDSTSDKGSDSVPSTDSITTKAEVANSNEPAGISGPSPTPIPIPDITTSITPTMQPLPTATPVPTLTPEERTRNNSISMLNHLTLLSQEINSSKNSRLYLEKAYNSILNNINPESVNDLSESYLVSLLDTIEKYRMISVKRERLRYLYEQNQAKNIRAAIPNPLALLSFNSASSIKGLVGSLIYMAVDSYSSYETNKNELNQMFIQQGWELDDEEAANLHESRKRAFSFMIEIVNEEKLPGNLALNEDSVKKFVDWKNDSGVNNRLQFFESNQDKYEMFGDYWIALAQCYYEVEKYKECLEAIEKYEEIQSDIFRLDYSYADILPIGIAAAANILDQEEYISTAERFLEEILANTDDDDWSSRYFVAQIYLDLYSKSNDKKYTEKSFEIVLNNVNYLLKEQQRLNQLYLNDVVEVSIPETATEAEKDQLEEYNEALIDNRKIELPPVYEPLELNCDLLFALVKERGYLTDEVTRIAKILRGTGESVFLTKSIDSRYSFLPYDEHFIAEFDGDISFGNPWLKLPVTCVSEESNIVVNVTDDGNTTSFTDWYVDEVTRENNSDIDTFYATYKSEAMDDYKWTENSKVEVIIEENDSLFPPTILNFIVDDVTTVAFLKYYTFKQVE